MTNLIRENSFELQLDGMNIKFTTLHERFDLFSSKRLLVRVSLDSFTNY